LAEKSIDKRLDRVYAAALEDFTSERDSLAGDLRKKGEREQAAEVKRLRKPSVPAWAINQASRGNAKQTKELIKAGDALRRAQGSLSSRNAREKLQAAQRRERELVRELASEAERALRDTGRPASAAVRDQIEETLHAAAIDPEVGELVGRGRLERPAVAVGFQAPGPGTPGDAPRPGGKEQRARDGLEKRLRRGQDQLAEATRKRETAESALREAERAAKEAARELERATRRAKAMGEREAELSERVEQLRDEIESK
jgi:hypothetical protein